MYKQSFSYAQDVQDHQGCVSEEGVDTGQAEVVVHPHTEQAQGQTDTTYNNLEQYIIKSNFKTYAITIS